MTPQDYLEAARVPQSLEAPQEFGLWAIVRRDASFLYPSFKALRVFKELNGWDTQTVLTRMTTETMHKDPPGWEIVMEDSKQELQRHLPIWMNAKGRVLVTGLGLGCVVRGLLASQNVDHIDVIELDKDILRVIGPEFANNSKVTLIHADALQYEFPAGTKHDCAWHDLWCEGHGLTQMHMTLFSKYWQHIPRQGAWAFPKVLKRGFKKRFSSEKILG